VDKDTMIALMAASLYKKELPIWVRPGAKYASSTKLKQAVDLAEELWKEVLK